MKVAAPAAATPPAVPAPDMAAPAAPATNAGGEDLDFGGEAAPADDKPFDDEPFDAGVEADEDTDPKKFIEQLSGKIGQSLRKYTDETGQPDFELEKFAINSLLSATHTAEMDEDDKKDIIKKVNTSGAGETNDLEDSDMGDDENDSEMPDMGDDENLQESEMTNLFLDGKGKRMSIYAPEGSPEFMEVNRLDENNPCWTGYEKVAGKGDYEEDSCRKISEKSEGLWANIHAKKERGESPAKPGDEDYPDKKQWDKLTEEEGESNNYMFWLNLKGIHDDVVEMLHMEHSEVDNLLADGHQWAFEHVVTSKDDIEEVYHFLEGNMETGNMMEGDMGESNNYMFWSSLKTIAHASGELLGMDKAMVDNILSDGHGWALDHIATSNDDIEEVYHFLANTLDAYDGDTEGGYEDEYGNVEDVAMYEGKYDGKKLGKPTKGDVKKFKVYVKNKKGNVIKVNFGDPNMEIKRDNPKRKKSFRARHKCAQAKDRTTPKYWSCKMWSSTPVSKMVAENLTGNEKFSIFGKDLLKTKLHETFNLNDMSETVEPIVQPIVKPTTTPAPSRRNRPFTIDPDSVPQTDPKALTEALNVKTINVYVPDEIILKKITNTPTFNRVFGSKLTVGNNEMRVNHKQYADIIRLKDMLSGVEVTDKTKAITENLNKLQVYHNTFSSAVQTAGEYAKSKGYELNDDEWFNTIATGPKKPQEGETNRYTLTLYKDGKEQRKALHIQVYGMKNKYELNTYIA